MDKIPILFLILGAGFVLGTFFFGGLWWTTRKAMVSKSPALWFSGSLIVRLGITLIALYYISQKHWERMLICLLGFVIARYFVIKLTKRPEIKHNKQ